MPFAAKVRLTRMERTKVPGNFLPHNIIDVWVPMINVHHDDCKKNKGCCAFWYEKCYHLASDNLEEGRQKARDLARRIGVPCDV